MRIIINSTKKKTETYRFKSEFSGSVSTKVEYHRLQTEKTFWLTERLNSLELGEILRLNHLKHKNSNVFLTTRIWTLAHLGQFFCVVDYLTRCYLSLYCDHSHQK